MAAISANLLAATAPPVNPPVSRSAEPTPTSGFANVLTETVNRRTTAAETSTAADATPPDDAEPADETTDVQADHAAIGLVPPPLPPLLVVEPTPTTATGTTDASGLPITVPALTIPSGVPATTGSLASRAENLRFTTPAAQPTTPTAADQPTVPTTPANPTAELPTHTRETLPGTQPLVAQQAVTVPVATTSAETTAAATRPLAVAPQVPVVTDRGQQLPVLPPEVGYGLVNPNVPGAQEVKPVPPVGAGTSQAQVEVTATALPTPIEPTELPQATRPPSATPEPPTQSFARVLADQHSTPVVAPGTTPPTTAAAATPNVPAAPQVASAFALTDAPATVAPASATVTPTAGTAFAPELETNPDTTPGILLPGTVNSLPQPEAPTATTVRPTTAPEPAVAPQLSEAFATHARVVERGGTYEFQLRLDPPELGEVKVRVLAMGDRVEARLVVSDDTVKRLIESQLPELRQRLEAAGVSVPKFDITTGEDGRANSGGRWEQSHTATPAAARTAPLPRPAPHPTASGGLIDVTA